MKEISLIKKVITILVLLIFVSCENQVFHEKEINNKIILEKKDKESAIDYKKKFQGKWYVPTLSKSFVEIKENEWYTQSEEFNIMTSHKIHWLNSNQLELEEIKNNIKGIINIGNKDTITIIELTQDIFLYIENKSKDTVCLVRNKMKIDSKIARTLNR